MSGKKEKRPPQDLAALEDSYTIVGELSAREHGRAYLGTRKADQTDVLILVEEAPAGDTGNALTLFAADVNLLAGVEHRGLIPIHEGRWVGEKAFAVVTDRCPAPTLETLVARGEAWTYPRIATVLHEINGLLEWARQQKVVHRTLTIDTVHLEPTTDRVLASFVAQPLTRQGPPGAEGDARTIAQIAWALITRGRDLPQTAEDSLGVVRPELPRRVVEATDALLHQQRIGDTEPPSVLDYIGLVAMTDEIARGESQAAELQATIYQEQLVEREAWATKEREYQERMSQQDRDVAAEREAMATTLATERQQMADERAELERKVATERAEMERTLTEARAEMERTLTEEREQMARTLADERAAMERTLTEERERLAAERADLEQRVASEREQLAALRLETEQQVAAELARVAEERAAQEAAVARERTEMAETLTRERAELEQRLRDERSRLEATLSDEQQRMLEERTGAEAALAAARAEFEAAMTAQREEFESRLAREREEFEQAIIAERNALEAEKEGFAVYNAAEREAIDAERRALEELYLAYEAEGHLVEDADEADRIPVAPTRADRVVAPMAGALADIIPPAVPQPTFEPESAIEPAETEAGLTRADAKRSRRAALGVPLSVLLLVSVITATAVGIGAGRGDDADDGSEPATPTVGRERAATPAAPTVIDSAGGAVVTPDSTAVTRDDGAATTAPAPRRTGVVPARQRPETERAVVEQAAPSPASPDTLAPRPVDTAVASSPPRTDSAVLPPLLPPANTVPQRDTGARPNPTLPPVVPPAPPPGSAPAI